MLRRFRGVVGGARRASVRSRGNQWSARVSVSLNAQTTVVRPAEIDDVLVNPGMGIETFQRFNGQAAERGRPVVGGRP